MYFPKEIWREIKNYMLGKEYWQQKMNENFTFKGIYFFRPCDLMYSHLCIIKPQNIFSEHLFIITKKDCLNKIIKELYINTFVNKKEFVYSMCN